MDITPTGETTTPAPDAAPRTFRLRGDVRITAVDACTLRLAHDHGSLLLHGPAAENRDALEALRTGVPVEQASEAVRHLWRHRMADLYPAQELQLRQGLARVRIDGLDDVGAHLADHLAAGALGTLVLQDPHPVDGSGPGADLAGLGGSVHRGRARADALREILTRHRPATPVFACPPGGTAAGVDVHVMCDPEIHRFAQEDLERFEEALAAAPAVLPISRSAQGGGRIGPLLAPGRGLCVQCLELHRADRAAVDGQSGSAPPAERRSGAADEPSGGPSDGRSGGPSESVADGGSAGSRRIVSAVAARQIQVLLGGQVRPAVVDSVLVVDDQGRVTERTLGRHTGCTCVAPAQPRGCVSSPSEPSGSSSSASDSPVLPS